MEIQQVAIEKLIPYERNNKIHTEEQIKKIAKSIKECGFRAPILVDENRVILAGHGRLEWAKKLKMKEVPVIQYTDLTEEQKKKYRILDNRIGDFAEYDLDALKEELREIDDQWMNEMFEEFDLGLDQEEWNEDTEDDVPVVNEEEETIVQEWDIFSLQGTEWTHILICWDSTKEETYKELLKRMNIEAFDMLFTDPPYNVNYKGKWKNTSRGIMNDRMGDDNFKEFLSDMFAEVMKATKPTAPLYIFHSHTTQRTFGDAMEEQGMEIISQLIRNKPSVNHVGAKYKQKHEPFFYARKRGQKEERYGSEYYEQTVQDIPDIEKMKATEILDCIKHAKSMEAEWWTTIRSMKRHNVNDYIHPTQKPVGLVEHAIQNSSKKRDTVLEPFGWSGTTLIASEKQWRICWIIELDPHYVQAILKRYKKQTKKQIKCLNREINLNDLFSDIEDEKENKEE